MPTLDLDRTSYYNDMGIDTLWTGDLAQRSLDISIDVRPPVDVEDLASRRRGFERYDLTTNRIRATLFHAPGTSPHFGRLTNASVTGMWVQTQHPLPFRSSVSVEWCVMGFSQVFPGRVVRHTDDGMAIHLETNDDSWRFRSSFIDLARTPSADPPSVVIRVGADKSGAASAQEDALMAQLNAEWELVLEDFENDERHQAFIHACLRGRRLQFALEIYREVKSKDPSSEVATRYLKQIGTILSFYTLQSQTAATGGEDKKRLFPFIIMAMIVIALLLLAPGVLSRKMSADKPAPVQLKSAGFSTSHDSPDTSP